jgi:hypothetical protein
MARRAQRKVTGARVAALFVGVCTGAGRLRLQVDAVVLMLQHLCLVCATPEAFSTSFARPDGHRWRSTAAVSSLLALNLLVV